MPPAATPRAEELHVGRAKLDVNVRHSRYGQMFEVPDAFDDFLYGEDKLVIVVFD